MLAYLFLDMYYVHIYHISHVKHPILAFLQDFIIYLFTCILLEPSEKNLTFLHFFLIFLPLCGYYIYNTMVIMNFNYILLISLVSIVVSCFLSCPYIYCSSYSQHLGLLFLKEFIIYLWTWILMKASQTNHIYSSIVFCLFVIMCSWICET